MTSSKKPGVAFWATVVLVVAILYFASFSVYIRFGSPQWLDPILSWFYSPFDWIMPKGPGH